MTLAVLPAAVGLLPARSATAAPPDVVLPDPKPMTRVKLVKDKKLAKGTPARTTYARFDPSTSTSLPAAQSTTVSLLPQRQKRAAAAVAEEPRQQAGSSPVSVAAPAKGESPQQVRVTTVEQKVAQAAGVRGVMFSLQSTAGSGVVDVDVDESSFKNAFGGDFGSRLRLVKLPACAMTTPELEKCQTQTPVRAAASSPLSAKVSLAASSASVLAATAGASGSSGDYSATSLSPGGTWSVSGNTGSFTYSVPIAVPPPIAGVAPSVGLSYSSAGQDARTAGTNNQSSWVGDGWSTGESFIERTYRSCGDVKGSGAPEGSGDQCWAGELLTMSLNGSSSQIVYDDKFKTFHPVSDSSTIKIEKLSGAKNGTRNEEYFHVIENGTHYYFGMNRLPGWTAGAEETKSAWTVPIYKAHDGVNACPDGSFGDTACTLGYRFNLDYVVDPNGNAMAYYYAPETGHYGANMKKAAVEYTRAGTVKRIDYGLRPNTIYSGPAPGQVLFDTVERCLRGEPSGNTCGPDDFTVSHPNYWPDVPIDLHCAGGKDCANHSPSFWSRRMLTTITTRARVGGAAKDVDRYELTHAFPDNGDHAPTLWLDSVKHVGLDRLGGAGQDASVPEIRFLPKQLANRVGTLEGLPKMYYHRIGTVLSESGAETVVDYSTPNCSGLPKTDLDDEKATKAQAFASTNSTGCFPVFWTPEGQPTPAIDWFYTHPVKSVTTYDRSNHFQDGTQPKLVTEYEYKGKPGWHYDDNEVVKAKYRTWGQFRGYPEVHIKTGDTSVFHYTDKAQVHDRKTLTKAYYFLGMDGDTLPGGGSRNLPALESQDGSVSVSDDNELAGRVFETETYTGDGGTLESSTVTVPTILGPTASRFRDGGLEPLRSSMVRTAKTLTRQKVSYGWRKTETATFYNTSLGQTTTGMPVQTADRGEPGATGNVTTCTFTRYLDGSVPTLVVPAEVVKTDQDCPSAKATPSGKLLSQTRTSYDGKAFAYNGDGQASPARPAKNNPTLVQQASVANGAVATAFVDMSTSTYDAYGRVTSTTRTPNSLMADKKTKLAQAVYTRFSPSEGELPGSVVSVSQVTPGVSCATVTQSSKDCQLSTVVLNPARQLPIGKTDIAGAQSSTTYDALGRTTAMWLPNKNKAAGAPANYLFDYKLSTSGPSVVTTRSIQDSDAVNAPTTYRVGKVLYDGMLRKLETQDTGENGSVIVSDFQYDSHGRTVLTNNAYAAAGSPKDSLVSDQLSQVSVPSTTVTDYDGMGRATLVTQEHNGVKSWSSRTAYVGDKTTVIPPTGAMAITKVGNARGQITKLQQYTTAPTLSGNAADGYTASGGTSHDITYDYTSAGQQKSITGPDDAVWSYVYDLRGRQTSRKDPDAGTSFSGYDDAGSLVATKDARGIELNFSYDLLSRKLAATNKTKDNFKYASWTYDTLRIGAPTSSSRHVQGVTGAYTVEVTGYSTLGKPLGQTVTLPTVERPLPTTYTTTFAYSPNNERLTQQTEPAVAGLPGELITYGYNALGAPTSTGSAADKYVSGTLYTDFGQPSKVTMGASSNEAQVLYSYEEETLRLSKRQVYRSQGIGPLVDELSYSYDDAGNPLSVTDKQSETGNTVTDTQCYRYNTLARLSEAWTAREDCVPESAPTAADVATRPGSYWQSFTYNAIGDRKKLVDHSVSGDADRTTDYTMGCSANCNRTGAQPHTLTGSSGGTDPTKFVYDVAGNLMTRTPTGGTAKGQTLRWDDEGRLSEVTTAGATPATTKFLYDADGGQLIRRDPGRTTLFAGTTEIVIDTGVTPAVVLGGVRTYSHGGKAVASRSSLSGGGTSYLFNDLHGTAGLAMNTTTQQVSRQQYKPYGEARASANLNLWPDPTHGYLGASKNLDTGYTDLGARKYDPALGRFISPDPLLVMDDLNQLGGYTYSGDNPITLSDPSGMKDCDFASCDGGGGDANNRGKQGGGKPGGGRKDSDKPSGSTSTPTDPADDPDIGCNCGVGVNTKTGSRTQPPKFAEYAVIKTGHCAGYVPTDCHIADLDSGEIDTAIAAYLCEYFNDCAMQQAAFAASQHSFDETMSWFPIIGAPSAVRLAKEDWQKGNYVSAAINMVGLIPAGKAVKGGGKAIKWLRGGAKKCSFTSDTPVLMADGTTKPIDDVELGDVVLATDPTTGETSGKTVITLFDHIDTNLVDLTVVDAHKNTFTIHATQNHPFWDATVGDWVEAGALREGHKLVTADGAHLSVHLVNPFYDQQRMLNLEVDGFHTFYVLAGKAPVLVHNCGEGVPAGIENLKDGAYMATSDAMDTAVDFVGPGYRDMGGGRFLSEDGLRQVRLTDADLAHPRQNPHINFETYSSPIGPGVRGGRPLSNIHIYLPEESGWHHP
ncbi:polymorphic toxin-type HINT domain-containing protein [Actinoplanes sp. NPDC051346]|uniref:polymorphic toxin-type HINT domain-containing protein n=1 Tax=Actinoplanes sp. NPDC051346 TaxID=3155048 RepID=UPI0034265EA8